MTTQQEKAIIIEYLQERLDFYKRRVERDFEELRTNPEEKRKWELINEINHYYPVINEVEFLIQKDLQ